MLLMHQRQNAKPYTWSIFFRRRENIILTTINLILSILILTSKKNKTRFACGFMRQGKGITEWITEGIIRREYRIRLLVIRGELTLSGEGSKIKIGTLSDELYRRAQGTKPPAFVLKKKLFLPSDGTLLFSAP